MLSAGGFSKMSSGENDYIVYVIKQKATRSLWEQ